MLKIEKYNPTKTYMFPNGTIATPQIIQEKYPAVNVFQHIVETDEQGEVLFALQNLAAVRGQMGVDSSLSEDEAVAKIEELRNALPPEPAPSPEERIASALEFNNVLNM